MKSSITRISAEQENERLCFKVWTNLTVVLLKGSLCDDVWIPELRWNFDLISFVSTCPVPNCPTVPKRCYTYPFKILWRMLIRPLFMFSISNILWKYEESFTTLFPSLLQIIKQVLQTNRSKFSKVEIISTLPKINRTKNEKKDCEKGM